MLSKSVVGNRIKALRVEKGLSQEEFGIPVDLSKSAVSQIESGQIYPSLESIDKIVKQYSTQWDSLVGIAKEKNATISTPFRHLVTTVDRSGKDNIVLVPVKAQAGYLVGSHQSEYIEHLPTFWLPGLTHGIFRAFEVNGYSMLADRIGFFPGDIVIAEYVEKLEEIKDGLVYILVNDAQEVDNIVLKRCLNYVDKGGVIICKSDNKDPQYPTFPLPVEKIKEVWKFKMKLTRQAPEPSGLFDRINSLEGDMVLLREEMKKSMSQNRQ
jgi:transcriptional regulator with XRE-family HTH domain